MGGPSQIRVRSSCISGHHARLTYAELKTERDRGSRRPQDAATHRAASGPRQPDGVAALAPRAAVRRPRRTPRTGAHARVHRPPLIVGRAEDDQATPRTTDAGPAASDRPGPRPRLPTRRRLRPDDTAQ